jgi:hypothetical protein
VGGCSSDDGVLTPANELWIARSATASGELDGKLWVGRGVVVVVVEVVVVVVVVVDEVVLLEVLVDGGTVGALRPSSSDSSPWMLYE